MHKKILIIADIEGSTGCADYEASSFNTLSWYDACIEMSLDINAVVLKLLEKGAEKIYIKDFHRTGYNLLPELIDGKAQVIHGYREGPVPGIGDVYDAEAVMFIGMHASSGSGGFLAHTLTSKYSRIMVNGKRISELQIFASSLYGHSLKPLFFSGCPAACIEAEESIRGINVYPVIKNESGYCDKIKTRNELALAACESLENTAVSPYLISPPFVTELDMRDGSETAEKKGRRWRLNFTGDTIVFTASDFDDFYNKLIKITYFTPLLAKVTPAALFLFNLYGRIGLSIVRWRKRIEIKKLITGRN
jgi:D-aminopeptidase